MNKWFNTIKGYYDTGLWNIHRVWNVVGKVLSEEEYKVITGFDYPSKGDEVSG